MVEKLNKMMYNHKSKLKTGGKGCVLARRKPAKKAALVTVRLGHVMRRRGIWLVRLAARAGAFKAVVRFRLKKWRGQ